jgi:hypothetical protein
MNNIKVQSKRCHQAPGGNSTIQLNWEGQAPATPTKTRNRSKVNYNIINCQDDPFNKENTNSPNVHSIKTAGYSKSNFNLTGTYEANDKAKSIKVTTAPGGRSNIIFGNDSSNYEEYRRKK